MTIKRGVNVDGQFILNGNNSLFTPGTGITRAVVTAVNMYANVATTGVELYIIPNGGSPSASNRILKKTFSQDESYNAPELIGQSIEDGATITGNDGGNGGTDVNITLTVTTFSGDS